MAATATHRHVAVRVERRAVAQRDCRSDTRHGGLRSGALAVFRLVSVRAGAVAAYLAAAIYALNPNLLYLQATAMNEPIFLAFFLWTLVYLDEFLRATFPPETGSAVAPAQMKPRHALEACGITMAGGALTRYDGWFSATIVGLILMWAFFRWMRRTPDSRQRRAMTKSLAEVLLLNALVPVYWLVYTYFISGRAMDFATGPYSAKAIALRTTSQGAVPYPGQHHLLTSALYFLKAAQLNIGPPLWGELLFVLALTGTGLALWRFRTYGILLLLWLPLAFYALSIAYGSVPIYIPVGTHSRTTTFAMDWNCCRYLRSFPQYLLATSPAGSPRWSHGSRSGLS